MFNYDFQNPAFLWLLSLLPLLGFWYYWKRKDSHPEISFPEASFLAQSKFNRTSVLHLLPKALRLFTLAFLILALARPVSSEEATKSQSTEGIDIILAIDVSSSMLARDLQPNRLEATKVVATEFIDSRPNDRIGLVAFSGESYTQTPLTSDHAVLKNSLRDLNFGYIESGTAIGLGLATSLNRLKDSKAKSKVAILLTDGENNRGEIEPLTAAKWCKELGVRVYTIGVGTRGRAPTPVQKNPLGGLIYQNQKVVIDEGLLKEIASETGGQYFRATDADKLLAIYQEIDSLEKTKLQELKFYAFNEEFNFYALIALGLFSFEILLRYTLLKSFV
jgi:Ca-activated chloride channel family protein